MTTTLSNKPDLATLQEEAVAALRGLMSSNDEIVQLRAVEVALSLVRDDKTVKPADGY